MNKKVITVHRILFFADVLLLFSTLVYYLIKWGSLPDDIGIHFAGDGSFDVVASKVLGFYPHLIGGLIIGGIALADRFIIKKGTGLRLSEKGEHLLKAEVLLTLDVFLFLWCIYFSMWSWSVSTQTPLDKELLGEILNAVSYVLIFSIIAQIVTYIKFREKAEGKPKDTGMAHRLCRLVAWLLVIGGIGMVLEVWDRLPGDEDLYYDPAYNGLAYIANFGEYMDKRLLLIPHIVSVVLLAVFEILSARAAKAQKSPLISLYDKLKLLCGVFFFWWEIMLWSEQPVGIVSVGIFTGLCAAAVIMYVIQKRKSKV